MPTCPACNYSLIKLPAGPCPECGRPFDPADPATLAHRPAVASLAPHHAINIGFALICLYLSLIHSTRGGTSESAAITQALFFLATAAIWTLAFLVHLIARVIVYTRSVIQPPWRWRWLAIPISLAVWVLLLRFAVIWDVRWYLSKDAFAARIQSPKQGRIGLFYSTGIQLRPDGSVRFRLGFPDLYSDGPPYIVFSPGIRPGGMPMATDLGGGWWLLTDPT